MMSIKHYYDGNGIQVYRMFAIQEPPGQVLEIIFGRPPLVFPSYLCFSTTFFNCSYAPFALENGHTLTQIEHPRVSLK